MRDDHRIFCWGSTGYGELGVDPWEFDANTVTLPPLLVPAPQDVLQVSAGDGYTCAVTSRGTVECCGSGAGGLGRPWTYAPTPYPALLLSGRRALQVAAGYVQTCVLLDDKTVWCWGARQGGALGTGAPEDTNHVSTPTKIEGLEGPATEIHVGSFYACASLEGGAVQCWGQGPAVADDTAAHPTPVKIAF